MEYVLSLFGNNYNYNYKIWGIIRTYVFQMCMLDLGNARGIQINNSSQRISILLLMKYYFVIYKYLWYTCFFCD